MENYLDVWARNATTMIALPIIGVFFLFALKEGWRAALIINTKAYDSGVRNILLMLVNSAAMSGLVVASGVLATDGLGGVWPTIDMALWDNVPYVLAVIFTIAALDFTNYWNHRILHSPALWAVHVIHHSDRHMNWTTTYRVHLLELGVMFAGWFLLMGWMSVPVHIMASAAFVHSVYNKYVHCQLGWTHGPLRRWLISPNYHRWHHAADAKAYDKNFGDIFAVWDRMFGTHYDPGTCACDIGLDDGPQTIGEMMVHPFVAAFDWIFKRANASKQVAKPTYE